MGNKNILKAASACLHNYVVGQYMYWHQSKALVIAAKMFALVRNGDSSPMNADVLPRTEVHDHHQQNIGFRTLHAK